VDADVSKSPAGGAGPVVYRCRMCHYRSDKVTVVKHHVMSHLFYHPYRCPYCDAARSVKSSPINKHVRLRHPGQQPNFVYQRDEELERFAASLTWCLCLRPARLRGGGVTFSGCPSVRLSVWYQTCERSIVWNRVDRFWCKLSQMVDRAGKAMKRSALRVRRSKVKVTPNIDLEAWRMHHFRPSFKLFIVFSTSAMFWRIRFSFI